MHSEIKKAFLSTVVLLLCTACFTAVIVYPRTYIYEHHNEGEIRRELAGTLELLVSGASQGKNAFDAGMMEEQLGIKCYNMATNMTNMRSRYFVLDKELKRNPVKTVVIEVASDALERNEGGFEIHRETLESLDSFKERLEYLRLEELKLGELVLNEGGSIFSESLEDGFRGWAMILRKGQFDDMAGAEEKKRAMPYYQAGSYEVPLSKESFMESYRGADQQSPYPFREDNCDYLEKCVELAKEKGARVILCKLPEPEARPLTSGYVDDLDAYMEALADSHQCEYYNFELVRGKADLFPERFAYIDSAHMSRSGKKTFTKLFCDVITSDHPEEYFWDTYEEAALHGAYAEWVKEIEEGKDGASGTEEDAQEG